MARDDRKEVEEGLLALPTDERMILRQQGGNRLALSLSTVAVEEDAADYAYSQDIIAAHAQTQ